MHSIRSIGWVRGHSEALYWVAMLYRRPEVLREQLQALDSSDACVRSAIRLCWHALPYVLLILVASRLARYDIAHLRYAGVLTWHLRRMAWSLAVGLIFGIFAASVAFLAENRSRGTERAAWISTESLAAWFCGTLACASGNFFLGFPFALSTWITILWGTQGNKFPELHLELALTGIGAAFLIPLRFDFPLHISAEPQYLTHAIEFALIWSLSCTRGYYQILFFWLAVPRPIGALYKLHPVSWDDLCVLPFPRLAGLLVAYTSRDYHKGLAEIERLIHNYHYPAQIHAAAHARLMLNARFSEYVESFEQLEPVLKLSPWNFRRFNHPLVRLQDELKALIVKSRRVAASSVPLVRTAEAADLYSQAAKLRRDLEEFGRPVFPLFNHAADHWVKLAEKIRDQARLQSDAVMWTQVFRAADRIEDRAQIAFVRRDEVIDELQQQILAPAGCPGIVLYGRRRVGKSTVLMNLRGFLPNSVSIAYFSLQDPELITDFAGFLTQLGSRANCAASPSTSPADVRPRNLEQVWHLLDGLNARLAEIGSRVLMALDEYENLDVKIGQGLFPADFLEGLRESIQRHHNIAWLLAGSHAIEELTHVSWTSYLVAARTIEVGMFSEEQTRILLTDPLRDAPLGQELVGTRIRFDEEFWGPQGTSRIHHEAGGWPHLVQLIAEAVVDLANRRHNRRVDDLMLEGALDAAIVRGHTTLYQLMKAECKAKEEWEYLSAFRTRDVQPIPTVTVLDVLKHRQLITADESGCRLRVPLMQRWLRKRG